MVVAFWLEEGVISDIAMVSLFIAFIARNAVLESTPYTSEVAGYALSFIALTIFRVQHIYMFDMLLSALGLGTPRMNISQFFTADAFISTALAIIALVSPFISTADTSEEPVTKVITIVTGIDNIKEPSKAIPIQQNMTGFFFVLLFTHVLLTCVGEISVAGTWFRIFQSVLTLAIYGYLLYEESEEGEREKSD